MQYFNLHTHKFTANETVLELVNQYPWEFNSESDVYSIGIHPWYIDSNRLEIDLAFIETKLNDKACLALGECGLDKRIEIDFGLQLLVLEKQLHLAQQFNKPAVIHCVAAFDELIALKNKLKLTVPIVIHGFSKSLQLANQLINNGFYLSFGKYLLRNPELEVVFTSISEEKFFLETDTIEESIYDVYALAAKYKNIKIEEIQSLVQKNFENIFGEKRIKNKNKV